jgi:hypothetical protein
MKVFVFLLGLIALASMCGGQIAEPEIHLIPARYMGNIYIFHNVPDGEPLKREGRARVGTLVSCIAGKLAYFETEDMSGRYILEK